jgi:hypothetical protein
VALAVVILKEVLIAGVAFSVVDVLDEQRGQFVQLLISAYFIDLSYATACC